MRNLLSMLCGANSAPAGVVHAGYSAANFATTRKLTSTDLIDFAPGKSMVLIIDVEALTSNGHIIGCGNGNFGGARKGWSLIYSGLGYWTVCGSGDATHQGYFGHQYRKGIVFVAMRWQVSDEKLWWSEGGQAASALAYPASVGAALDGTCQSSIGAPFTGETSGVAFTGGLLGCAIIDRELSDVELAALSYYGDGSRLRLPADAVSDPDATFIWEASADWDGVSATSVSRGSSPVTWTVTGAVSRPDVSETRYVFKGAKVSDSAIEIDHGTHYQHSEFAVARMTTDATRVGVEIFQQANNSYANCGLWTNGAFTSTVNLGPSAASHDLLGVADCFPGAGSAKTVEIVAGANIGTNATPEVVNGPFVTAIRARNSEGAVTFASGSKTRRVVFLCDSIFSGFGTTEPMSDSAMLLMRAASPAVGFTAMGWGNATLAEFNDATRWTATAATAAAIAAACNGTSANDVVIQVMTNDYGGSDVLDYEADLTALCSALESGGITGLHIWLFQAIQRIAPSSEGANAYGDTLADFRATMTTVAALNPSGRTVIGGTGVVSNVNMAADGIHVNTAGNVEIQTHLETALSL